jgi:predicted RNA-binding protein with PUA-like domain
MYYLLKTEPSEYSFADLERDKATVWDGVTNPVAVRNLRGMKKGDQLIIYHTGDEKSAVGMASVLSVEAPEGKPPQVKIEAGKKLKRAVSLAEIKADKRFADSALVRQGRLSVVPLNEAQYRFLTE